MPPEIPAWNMPPGGKRSSGMTEACMLGGTATIIEKRPVVQSPVTTSPYYRSGNTVGDIAEFRVVRRNAAGNTGVEHASWRQAILRNDRGMHAWRNACLQEACS